MKRFRNILILCVAASAVPAYASIKKPKSYPATEEGPSLEVISSAPGYRGQTADTSAQTAPNAVSVEEPPAPQADSPVQQRLPAPPKPQAQANVVTAAPPAPAAEAAQDRTNPSFDQVPADQVEPLARRLQIVETLVTKYGRAYDYRALTISQLEAILGKLDTQATEASELRRRLESRTQIKQEVREEENAQTNSQTSADDNSLGSEAPEAPIPPPSQ